MTTNKPGSVNQRPLYGCTSCFEDFSWPSGDLRVYGDEIDVGYECMRIRDLCKTAPPAPDVSALVEALERINGMNSMSYHSLESAKIVARNALAAHRKQQENEA